MSFALILPFLRPIESLLLGESVGEIMGNPDCSWSSERDGRLCQEPNISFDTERLETGLEVIANQLGKRLDEYSPTLHAQLPDGSRLAAWIPPIVSPPPAIGIRKFTSRNYTINDLIAHGTLTQSITDLLAEQICRYKTLLITGGTGTAKTTLRILAKSIPEQQRSPVIEETPELHIRKPNIVAAQSQTDTSKNTIRLDELLKDTLRFKPDPIVLGEVSSIQAIQDRWRRSMPISAEKALRRFSNLVMCGHPESTVSDTEAEIREPLISSFMSNENQDGGSLHDVLAIRRYHRDAKRSRIGPVFETQVRSPAIPET